MEILLNICQVIADVPRIKIGSPVALWRIPRPLSLSVSARQLKGRRRRRDYTTLFIVTIYIVN